MKEKINKEVSDALHMLLHCSLKDTEYNTQINQFNIVYKHIEILEEELKSANEEITWWSNRFKAVERDNRQLKKDKKKAIELLDELNIKIKDILKIGIDIKEISDIREILGEKESR